MVWFQCEDCGEDLKKPKLPNHFRICSAFKFSCIDCGQTFSQQSVQAHTQCISEAEKYGPKGQARAAPNVQTKTNNVKQYPDVDINVGLSSHTPWFCSLCNTNATSKQTLMLHAEGKKHRAKARAFHAAQNQSTEIEEPSSNEDKNVTYNPNVGSDQVNGSIEADKVTESGTLKGEANLAAAEKDDNLLKKKRKHDAANGGLGGNIKESKACNLSNEDLVQAEQTRGPQCQLKKKKYVDVKQQGENHADEQDSSSVAYEHKIKLKKIVVSALKEHPDGVMKIKKLQRQVIKVLQELGMTEDEEQLRNRLMDKINSSSRFTVDSKCIRLVAKTG